MHFHFVLVSLAVLILVYYIGVAIYLKRSEREIYEEFAQVAMINNSGMPNEWPVYTPQFPAPPRKCCKKKCGGTPLVLPNPPDAAAPSPPASTPAAPEPRPTPTPANPTSLPPGRRAVTPIAAPTRQIQIRDSVNYMPPGMKEKQYVCAVPQYTVCEVVPAPPISFHAFRFVAIGDGKSFMKGKVSNVEDSFKQTDIELQPELLQTEPEWESVPYFAFVKSQTIPYMRTPPATLDVQKNKGCSIVALVRIQNYDFGTDVTLMGMTPEIYVVTVNEFKYYIQNNRWMLYIKVWDEGDDGTGVAVRSYLDFMNEKDEVYISQNQSALPMPDVKTVAVARPGVANQGLGAALSIESAMATHVAYASVYDRALIDKERNLIRASVEKILENQPIFSETIEAIVDYDIVSIKALERKEEHRLIKNKSPRSGFDLKYNVNARVEKYSFKPFTSVQLTKNDKYYTDRPAYLEMPDGYSMELMFSVQEFSNDVASVIFCYSVIAAESSIPQLIAGVTATDSAKGNLFYVQYFTQDQKTGRLESSVRISPGEWYHVIVTSESKVFINGVRDTNTRGRAVTNFPAASGRYITIGDYKNPATDSTTSDYGNTMYGSISLARMYNAPITQTKVDELYANVKSYVKMESHLGGVKPS